MENLNRRDFIKTVSLGATFALAPNLFAGERPHIVIVGGGFAGSTCAKYLKLWGGSSIDVTIVEQNSNYVSPILSNLVLNNLESVSSLTFSHTTLSSKYNINVVNSKVIDVDNEGKNILLESGNTLSYDKLVLAPGIDFIPVNGHYFSQIPHAWVAGEQTTLLKQQIDAMVDGDEIIITVPKSPYRCPPGPYERACLVAEYLQDTNRRNCKVSVFDGNENFTVKADIFSEAFADYSIEYVPNVDVIAVDSETKELTYALDGVVQTKRATVLNIIPEQKAGKIIFTAGVNSGNWAPVDLLTYESTIKKGIYIIGDSQGSSQGKAGHIGNSEGKICADGILRSLNNLEPYDSPKTNSACYSPISTTQASWLTAVYQYNPTTKVMELVPNKGYPKSGKPSNENFKSMYQWTGNLFADSFS